MLLRLCGCRFTRPPDPWVVRIIRLGIASIAPVRTFWRSGTSDQGVKLQGRCLVIHLCSLVYVQAWTITWKHVGDCYTLERICMHTAKKFWIFVFATGTYIFSSIVANLMIDSVDFSYSETCKAFVEIFGIKSSAQRCGECLVYFVLLRGAGGGPRSCCKIV